MPPSLHTGSCPSVESTGSAGQTGSDEPGTCSSAGERALHTRQVVGSIPTTSTTSASERSYVYLIENGHGHVKIGRAARPEVRLRELATGSSTALRIVHHRRMARWRAARFETALHGLLAHFRLAGEWFDLRAVHIVAMAEALADGDPEEIEHVGFLLSTLRTMQDELREDRALLNRRLDPQHERDVRVDMASLRCNIRHIERELRDIASL